jgi:hypothetical protein
MVLLQKKIKEVLVNSEITDEIEEQKITKFEFPGCIHENIAPKDFPKECKKL